MLGRKATVPLRFIRFKSASRRSTKSLVRGSRENGYLWLIGDIEV